LLLLDHLQASLLMVRLHESLCARSSS
jgi:hypothetical protein